jgi:hypothetical protein
MSKRINSNFSIYSHLRMLLRIFPVRDAVAFRMAVAARIEADEATGEIFTSQGRSPRERLQDAAGIGRINSVDEAMSTIKKAGLIKGHRQYSKGQRKTGSDRLVLDWAKWEEACLNGVTLVNGDQEPLPALSGGQGGCTPLNGGQASPPLNGGQHPALSGGQGGALSGGQHIIRNTSTVTATDTAIPASGVDGLASFSTPKDIQAGPSTPLTPKVGSELQLQEPEVAEVEGGIPWVGPKGIPLGYAKAVYFNGRLGKLYLVRGKLGSAFYHALRDDGFSPAAIKAGLQAASSRASLVNGNGKEGGLEAAVRQHVQYAQEKESRAVASNSGRTGAFPRRPKAFIP